MAAEESQKPPPPNISAITARRNDYEVYAGYSVILARSFFVNAVGRIVLRQYWDGGRDDVNEIFALTANYRVNKSPYHYSIYPRRQAARQRGGRLSRRSFRSNSATVSNRRSVKAQSVVRADHKVDRFTELGIDEARASPGFTRNQATT